MYFNSISEIENLAKNSGCSVFALPENLKITLKNAIFLTPDDSKKTRVITVDQVREILPLLSTKQQRDRFIIIRPADALAESAANALLKSLEEPKNHYHFVLVTENPSKLLPTILSRSRVFYLRTATDILSLSSASEKNKTLARDLISASPRNLPALATKIVAKKPTARQDALDVLSLSVEMLWKSYYKTKNPAFLEKIPKFITAYDNIAKNGHVKLHLIADLL